MYTVYDLHTQMPSAECQKDINAVQQCFVENQKAATAIDFVRQ